MQPGGADFIAVEAVEVECDTAGGAEPDIDPGAVVQGSDGDGLRARRVRRGCTGRVKIVEAAGDKRQIQNTIRESAGVPVAEGVAGIADPDRCLTVVERNRAAGGADRELRIEVGDGRDVDAIQPVVNVEVAAIIEQVGIDSGTVDRVGKLCGEHLDAEFLLLGQIANAFVRSDGVHRC